MEVTTQNRKEEEMTLKFKMNENSITIAELAQLIDNATQQQEVEIECRNMAIIQAQEPITRTKPRQTTTRSKPRRNQQTKRKS